MQICRTIYGKDEDAMSIRALNTVAAVHAEAGNFEEAARVTRECIRRAKLAGDVKMIDTGAKNLVRYEEGRRLYE